MNAKILILWFLVILFILAGAFYLTDHYLLQSDSIRKTKTNIKNNPVNLQKQLITLKAIANDNTWLRIVIDNNKSEEDIIQKGRERIWNAVNNFQLRIGKANGIRLFLNEIPLESLGSENSLVWNLTIDKNGIVSKELRSRENIESTQTKQDKVVEFGGKGKYLSYNYEYRKVDTKFAVIFKPFLPREDIIVIGAMLDVINKLFGKHQITNLTPKLILRNGINLIQFEGIEYNYLFLIIKEDSGEVNSFSLWKEIK